MTDLVAAFDGEPAGAVLIDTDIRRLAKHEGLISEFHKKSLQPASYDLRLGSEYFLGEPMHLSDEEPTFTLPAGQFMVVTSREELKLPLDVVARAGLMSGWAQQGLISLLSTQIDPGFVGIMVVPILNAGHADVELRYSAPIFTVEFMRTTRPVKTGWVDLPTNTPQRGIPATKALEMASPPDLASVKERLSALEASVNTMQTRREGYTEGKDLTWVAISGVVAIVALILAVIAAF